MVEPTRRQRRDAAQQFFSQHPHCCFCGGTTRATTQDHVPPRTIFHERQWPEGYVFPACGKCNELTRRDEQIVSLVSRIYPDAKDAAGSDEVKAALRAVRNNFPGLLESMLPSTRDLRKAEREGVVRRAPGQRLRDLKVVSLSDDRIQKAIRRYSIKLTCALHYLHTAVIVPADGITCSRWFSNADAMQGKVPESIFTLAKEVSSLRRGKRDLKDQFSYAFAVTEDGALGMYIAWFRRSFAIAAAVEIGSEELLEEDPVGVQRPFQHK